MTIEVFQMGQSEINKMRNLKITLRSIHHSDYEIKMGHCIFYPPVKTDAISCTFNMNGFSPMKAVLQAHGLDEDHFQKCRRWHEGRPFRTITHGDEFPNIITSTRTVTWNEVPDAAFQVLKTVEDQYCKSLCMTHFAFILWKFPTDAFEACMIAVSMAWTHSQLQQIIVDVDERFFTNATQVLRQVQNGNHP
jgi:hypothetical protein